MHFAATTVMWVDLSFSSVLPIFHFPLLSLLFSLLLCIIPFPTYLDSLWDDILLGTHFPLQHSISLPWGHLHHYRETVEINPVIISYSVTPGHLRVAQKHLWGEENGPETTPSELCPSDKALYTACLCACLFIWFITKLVSFNYLSGLPRDSTVPTPMSSKRAMNCDLWPRVVCTPNTEQCCHYPILK